VQSVCPAATLKAVSGAALGLAVYELNASSSAQAEDVLHLLEKEKSKGDISEYSIHNSSLDDVFQSLMMKGDGVAGSNATNATEAVNSEDERTYNTRKALKLSNGTKRNPFMQAMTIFHKRWWVFRRSWISLGLGVLVAICGSCIPLFFLSDRVETCEVNFDVATNIPLFLPLSPLYGTFFQTIGPNGRLLESPPGVVSQLGSITDSLRFTDIANKAAFESSIDNGFRNLTLGGILIPTSFSSESSLLAWEASSPGFAGATLLNLVSNVLLHQQLNSTPSGNAGGSSLILSANYQAFPAVDGSSLNALRWVGFFGLTMVSKAVCSQARLVLRMIVTQGVFPAFFCLYISQERRSGVQAMQFSNGLSNSFGLWLGHLLFDSMFSIFVATVITIIFATTTNQFHGLGYFVSVLVLRSRLF
jgi:ATP-binding cassette subfamily A (ABC1) protein 3